MSGSTSWQPRDNAHHDRELTVELLDEFGPAGPYIEVVLRDLAGQQRHDGAVKAGFRSLSKKTNVDRDECRKVVEHAAQIGMLDDLEIDEDGRRFTCRISGWEADSTRGRNAMKKADQRARARSDEAGDVSTETGDTSPSQGDVSGSVPLKQDKKRRDKTPQPPTGATRSAQERQAIQRAQAAGFDEWLLDHQSVTGRTPPKATTKAYVELAKAFNGRIADSLSLADLKLATRGAHANDYRREHGYDKAESVLRPTKTLDLVNDGKRLQVRTQAKTTSGIDPRRLYGPSDEELVATGGEPIT